MGPSNAPTTQIEREEIRVLVLQYLAERSALAFRVEAIVRGLRREHAAEYTADQVEAALGFLLGLGYVRSEPEPMGATLSYDVTSAGVLAHERSGR